MKIIIIIIVPHLGERTLNISASHKKKKKNHNNYSSDGPTKILMLVHQDSNP